MYNVSNDFKIAAASNAQRHFVRGRVNGQPFNGTNVIRNSLNIRNQFTPATAIELGGVYIGQLSLEFTSQFADSMNLRGQWKGKVISLDIGLELDDLSIEWIPAPSGSFIIDEATWTASGLKVTAYDNMSKFDEPLPFDQTNGSLFDLLSLICNNCRVTFGMTEAQVTALTNGDLELSIYPGHSMKTYRDMLSQIATASCTFATIDRLGRLILKELPSQADTVDTIDATQRASGAAFSDFASFYTLLLVTNMEDDSIDSYSNDTVNGLVMDIGANPFLQYGTKPIVELMRKRIIDKLGQFKGTPFSVAVLTNPAYDLGDMIRFTGGFGAGSYGCVMSYDLKLDFVSIAGFGENPAAAAIVTDLAKEVSSQRQVNQRYQTIYYNFVNSSELEIGQDEEPIMRLRFVAFEQANVQIWHEMKMINEFTTDSQILRLKYYLDDEEVNYSPEQTFGEDGPHTFNTLYWLNGVEPGVTHTWVVTATSSSGTIYIDADDLRASLYGQGLFATDSWDGIIEASEEYTLTFGGVYQIRFEDAAEYGFGEVESIEATDNYSLFFGGVYQIGFTDDVSIFTAINSYNWIDQNGDKMVDSDGDSIIFVG